METQNTGATSKMAAEFGSLSSVTKTGKPKYAPTQSALYSVNACPPVRYLGKLKFDYVDASGNRYYDVLKADHLKQWLNESILKDLIAESYDADADTVFFVRQGEESKKDCAVFTLPDAGEAITLYTRNGAVAHTGVIADVGQRSSTSYTARGVRWMLVRALTSEL